MARRSGLGRGLDALIPGDETPPTGGVLMIPLDRIASNPRQPRTSFGEEELQELAVSIKEHGIIQPLIVTVHPESSENYILIAGERRWLAAGLAGLEEAPVIVREASEQQRLEIALVENVQRSDLGPLETAEAYRQLAEDFNLSHEEIAQRVGKGRTSVTNTLRLLKLPEDVRAALADRRISEGHARALLGLSNSVSQSGALQTILIKKLSVRQTEELVQRLSRDPSESIVKYPLSPELFSLEERLRSHLGTRVRLTHHSKGGTIVIHYYSDEELNAIADQLLDEGNSSANHL